MRWLVITLAFGVASPAYAFHTEDTFEENAATGGASGIFYTGSPLSKRWTCAACHLDAPGTVSLSLNATPRTLFTDLQYEPGQTYMITVGMTGETKGLAASSNYNSFALEILDPEAMPVGGFFGFDQAILSTIGPSDGVLFAIGQKNLRLTEWSFSWQAPMDGPDYLDFYLAGVDGDGANDATVASSNPGNDDVVTGALRIAKIGTNPPPPIPKTGVSGSGCTAVSGARDGSWLVLLSLVWAARRRR